MTTPNLFSKDELEYLLHHPEVFAAREKLGDSNVGKVYFTVPLTTTLRETLCEHLDLDFSSVSNVPMRWIVGDSFPHTDSGASKFKHTYLAYLNDCPGEFIVDGVSHPIMANTAHIF